jgi:hypothetical protein
VIEVAKAAAKDGTAGVAARDAGSGLSLKARMNLAWTAVRIIVVAAPFVLHFGTADVAPMLGSSTFPAWTVGGSVAAALAATSLGVYDLRLLSKRSNKRLWVGCMAATVVLTPVAGLLLYFAIDMLAAILAIPYALAAVCTLARVLRR